MLWKANRRPPLRGAFFVLHNLRDAPEALEDARVCGRSLPPPCANPEGVGEM